MDRNKALNLRSKDGIFARGINGSLVRQAVKDGSESEMEMREEIAFMLRNWGGWG